jgi:hypothetical protein
VVEERRELLLPVALAAVCAPAPVTRRPGSESGTRVAGSPSPRPPPLAPPAPTRIAALTFVGLSAVGSEEAPGETLASVRRSNWTCGFPASSFYERPFRGREGMSETRLTSLNSSLNRLAG